MSLKNKLKSLSLYERIRYSIFGRKPVNMDEDRIIREKIQVEKEREEAYLLDLIGMDN